MWTVEVHITCDPEGAYRSKCVLVQCKALLQGIRSHLGTERVKSEGQICGRESRESRLIWGRYSKVNGANRLFRLDPAPLYLLDLTNAAPTGRSPVG